MICELPTSNVQPERPARCPTSNELDWVAMEAAVRRELVRADLTERQFRVAEFFVSATLERGRQFVKGVRLEELGTALGLTKGNVSEAIAELQEVGVLQVYRAIDGVLHRILPDSARWFVSWRYTAAHREGYLQALDVASGEDQGHLLERDPDLREAIAETSMETVQIRNPKSEIRTGTAGAQQKSEMDAVRFSMKRELVGESTESTLINFRKLKSTETATSQVLATGSEVVNNNRFTGQSAGSSHVVHRVPKLGTVGAPALVAGRVWERIEVKPRNWAEDEDVMKYLNRCVRLRAELWEGKTTLAQLFCGLYEQRRDVAVELVGTAVNLHLQRPNGWLNDAVLIEFGLKKRKEVAT